MSAWKVSGLIEHGEGNEEAHARRINCSSRHLKIS